MKYWYKSYVLRCEMCGRAIDHKIERVYSEEKAVKKIEFIPVCDNYYRQIKGI